MRKIIIIAIKNCYPGTTQHLTSNKLSMDSNQLTKNSGQWQTINKAQKEKNCIFTNIMNINFWQERLVKCNYSHRNKHYNLAPRTEILLLLPAKPDFDHLVLYPCLMHESIQRPEFKLSQYHCLHMQTSEQQYICTHMHQIKICTGSVACMSWNMHVRNYFELHAM